MRTQANKERDRALALLKEQEANFNVSQMLVSDSAETQIAMVSELEDMRAQLAQMDCCQKEVFHSLLSLEWTAVRKHYF